MSRWEQEAAGIAAALPGFFGDYPAALEATRAERRLYGIAYAAVVQLFVSNMG